MLTQLLTHGGTWTPQQPDYRRVVLVNSALLGMAAVFAGFIPINLLWLRLPAIAALDAVALAGVLAVYLRFRRGRRLNEAAWASVLIVAAALLVYACLMGHSYFGLVWICIFPGFAFFMLGPRRGLFATLGLVALLAPMLAVYAPSWPPAEFGLAAGLNLAVALACLTLQVHFYELSRQEVFAVLQAKQNEFERLSNTDALTGLPNRLRLNQVLESELARVDRGGPGFAVVLMDLDHFKKVNDVHGHVIGDLVLKELANTLRAQHRGGDCVGRWGGEEFLQICPDSGARDAMVVAERIRVAVAGRVFPVAGRVTISLGVAAHRAGENANQLLARADAALYAAKAAGRNRAELADPAG